MTPELVEWDDSSDEGAAWIEPDELEKNLEQSAAMRCYSVGYVAREDDQTLTIAQSYTLKPAGDVAEWGHALTIPKCAITRRQPVFHAELGRIA